MDPITRNLLFIDSESDSEIDITLSNLSRVTTIGFASMKLLHEKAFYKPLKHALKYYLNFLHLDDGNLQEICVTLKPCYQSHEDDYLEYLFRDHMNKYHRKYQALYNPQYIFVPEYTARGIVHWHGIVHYPQCAEARAAYLKRSLNKHFGLTTGKPVYDFEHYWAYMMKDIKTSKPGLSFVTNCQVPLGD